MEKTAVEYLEEIIYGDKEFSLSEVFNKAKEIEKNQIIKVFIDVTEANCEAFKLPFTSKDKQDFRVIAETYYNQTFKSE